jgi:septum formation protein
VILASGSPQRRAILEQLGVAFTVIVPDVEELTAGPPEELVLENARRKASAVASGAAAAVASGPLATGNVVLGVDTIVALGSTVYGKPADRDGAAATLRALGGRNHRVLSGMCVIEGGRTRTATAVTGVNFRSLSEQSLAWYLDTGEWQGRAGGYAIQGRGAALVDSIEGDYLNVVGLPVATLLDLLPSLLFPAVSLQ